MKFKYLLTSVNSLEKIKSLSIWSKEIEIKPLEGGITNTNLNYLIITCFGYMLPIGLRLSLMESS